MLREDIIKTLEAKHIKSAGHNGISVPSLTSQLKCDSKELRRILNELYKEKLIATYLGIHGTMVKIWNEH